LQRKTSRTKDNFFLIFFLKKETEAQIETRRESVCIRQRRIRRRRTEEKRCVPDGLYCGKSLHRGKAEEKKWPRLTQEKKRQHRFRSRECNNNEKACGKNGRAERAYKKKNKSGEREREREREERENSVAIAMAALLLSWTPDSCRMDGWKAISFLLGSSTSLAS